MWDSLLNEAGLTEREVRSIMVLGNNPNMRASELAKELQTTRLDAYNSLSRLQEMGIVTPPQIVLCFSQASCRRSTPAHYRDAPTTTRQPRGGFQRTFQGN